MKSTIAIRQAKIKDDEIRRVPASSMTAVRLSVSCTRQPTPSRAARTKRRMACSSSTSKTVERIRSWRSCWMRIEFFAEFERWWGLQRQGEGEAEAPPVAWFAARMYPPCA